MIRYAGRISKAEGAHVISMVSLIDGLLTPEITKPSNECFFIVYIGFINWMKANNTNDMLVGRYIAVNDEGYRSIGVGQITQLIINAHGSLDTMTELD